MGEIARKAALEIAAQIDDDRLEGDAVLIQGDERLVAERGKRMEIELQIHGLEFPPS